MRKGYLVLLAAVFIIVALHGIIRSRCSSEVYDLSRSVDTTTVHRDSFPPKRTYPPRKKVEINRADSLALVSIYGIGPVFSNRILAYRRRLGGFNALDQLREIKGITDEVFSTISKNLLVDTTLITKINVNFADRKQFEDHPYFRSSMARRVVQGRMKGGFFNNQAELLERNILLPREARKVAPYLSFKTN